MAKPRRQDQGAVEALGLLRESLLALVSIGQLRPQMVDAITEWFPHHVDLLAKELPDRRAVLGALQPLLQVLIAIAEHYEEVVLTDYVEALIAESKEAGETFEEPGTPSRSFWAMFRAHNARLTRWVVFALVALVAGAASIELATSDAVAFQTMGVIIPFGLGFLVAAARYRKRLSVERQRLELEHRKKLQAVVLSKSAKSESVKLETEESGQQMVVH